jgi:transcriptional regulator with XRE-family HTH domain
LEKEGDGMKPIVRLKKIIEEKKLTQTLIASKTGINIKTINAILNERVSLKVDTLIVICEKGLNISIQKFFAYKFQ